MLLAAAMVVLAIVAAAGLVLDDRTVAGQPVWLKPLKFAISFAAYAAALAWMVSLLPKGKRLAHRAGTVAAIFGALEVAIIVTQAARRTRSHFNVADPFDETMWRAMGGTIMVFWVATLVIAIVLIRTPLADRAAAWAIRLGVLLSLAGMLLGVLMVIPTAEQSQQLEDGTGMLSGAHAVGVADGGPGMPFTGWSTTGGDLRIGHFIGLHALQALPLLAFALTVLDPVRRLRLVLVGAGTYAAVGALVTWQALRGQPLIHPDGATLAALALVALAAAGATVLALVPSAHADHDRPRLGADAR
jgi:hypothetical protein